MQIVLVACSPVATRHYPAPRVRAESLSNEHPIGRATILDGAAGALFVLLSVIYLWQAINLAAHAPWWMDEILTLWTARLPDVAAVWHALERGAEFTPPLYDEVIHLLLRAGITSALALRAPSILAIYIAALATGAMVRRHAGIAPAALAAGIVLSGGLFGFAVQMRPYALVTAAFACALALYDRKGCASRGRAVAIAMLLATAIGLHFYALLLVGVIGLLEFVRARVEHRAPCRRILAALGVAGCSILLWTPILLAARAYSGADVGAASYYAKPEPVALVRTYADLLGWQIFLLIALLVATVTRRAKSPLRITALVVMAAPAGIFVFALFVSHSYAIRYALAGGIGIALLFASLAQQLGDRAQAGSVVLLSLLVGCAPLRRGGEIDKADRREALAAIASAPTGLPIVTGSGLRYFEARENLASGRRLVFLDNPDVPAADPTNRNQLLRWKAINPDLLVSDARTFVCATPAFYLFTQPRDGGADALPAWLAARLNLPVLPADRASLTLVHPRPCANRPTE